MQIESPGSRDFRWKRLATNDIAMRGDSVEGERSVTDYTTGMRGGQYVVPANGLPAN